MIDNFDEVKKACVLAKQTDIKVIAIKNELEQVYTSDMINFTELMNLKGENLHLYNYLNEIYIIVLLDP